MLAGHSSTVKWQTGFYVIECDTKDEAIEWAKKILLRDDRTVEVRPIWPR